MSDEDKDVKRPHLKEPYNRRANMLLGFDTEKEYRDFFNKLATLYEDNPKTTISSLCEYAQREYDVKLYYPKLRRKFQEMGVELRNQYPKRYRRHTKEVRATVDIEDYQFVEDIAASYEGKYMKREFTKFLLHLFRGKPSNNMLLWLGEFKPVIFLFEPKKLFYTAFCEDLSDLEAQMLDELLAQVEETKNLEPVKAFARERGLMYWGGNKEESEPHNR